MTVDVPPSLTGDHECVPDTHHPDIFDPFLRLRSNDHPGVVQMIFDVNPIYPYLSGALVLSAVFLMSLFLIKQVESAPDSDKAIIGKS